MTIKQSNFWMVLVFLQDKPVPYSVAEMLREKLKIPRSTLYDTIDQLIDYVPNTTMGDTGTPEPLVEQVNYQYERTNYRFRLTAAGRAYIINNQHNYVDSSCALVLTDN